MALAQVVILNNKSVYGAIDTFLRSKYMNSENTAINYEKDIRDFFKTMIDKEIEQLTENDLIFTHDQIIKYQLYLKERYASSTVNRKIASVRSLYQKLSAFGFDVNPSIFDVDNLKTTDSESYGVLTWDEVQQMIKLAKTKRNGQQKALLIELAVVTSFRLNSLLALTWDNFTKKDGVWVVSVIGKGKKLDEKSIRDDLYERLKKYCGKEKLFEISERTARNLISDLVEELGFDEERNITFHSLKKCGMYEAYHLSGGDILTVAQQGAHQSPQTSLKYYMNFKKDYTSMVSLQIGQELDLSILNELSKEELIEIINGLGNGVKLQILNEAKKHIDK